MEYTLFQDFALKILRPVPPTGRPGRAQSGRTPEFGYGPLSDLLLNLQEQVSNLYYHVAQFS